MEDEYLDLSELENATYGPDIYEVELQIIMEYYENDIYPELPTYVGAFIDSHWEYKDLFFGPVVSLGDILYFIRNKKDLSKDDLFKAIVKFVEIKHGIFEGTK